MTANIVVSLIKMAHADYVTFKMNETEYRTTIGNIQNKVESIQDILLSAKGQKSSFITDKITSFDPHKLFNRIILFPSPPAGSRLQKVLS